MTTTAALTPEAQAAPIRVDSPYSYYVLFVLVLVYILNYLDRNILSVLAEDIKASLSLSDADLGFLFGTAFALFYATFGIALARVADLWNRKNLISASISFWSVMTALSGTAGGILSLGAFRFGVGAGEAGASPAALSLIYDYFSSRLRTFAVGIYASGLYIGTGLGLFLGGSALLAWKTAFPDPAVAPLGLSGWQAVFIMVGLPGLLVAALTYTLREPARGHQEGFADVSIRENPAAAGLAILVSMIPLLNLPILMRAEEPAKAVLVNSVAGAVFAVFAYACAAATGDVMQWSLVAIGCYALWSWLQVLAQKDRVTFGMMIRCPTLMLIVFANGANSFAQYSLPFWGVPYIQRAFGAPVDEIGRMTGLCAAGFGLAGVLVGGFMADYLRRHTAKGKLMVLFAAMIIGAVGGINFLYAKDLSSAYLWLGFSLFGNAALYGPLTSTASDLTLPRSRATVMSFLFMIAMICGAGLGSYLVGLASDLLSSGGAGAAGGLRTALLGSQTLPLFGAILVAVAITQIKRDETTLVSRARQFGETV